MFRCDRNSQNLAYLFHGSSSFWPIPPHAHPVPVITIKKTFRNYYVVIYLVAEIYWFTETDFYKYMDGQIPWREMDEGSGMQGTEPLWEMANPPSSVYSKPGWPFNKDSFFKTRIPTEDLSQYFSESFLSLANVQQKIEEYSNTYGGYWTLVDTRRLYYKAGEEGAVLV